MSSQYGTIDLSALPVVSAGSPMTPVTPTTAEDKRSESATDAAKTKQSVTSDEPAAATSAESTAETIATPTQSTGNDPVSLIERLGRLHEHGVLTDEEFTTKKRELLDRL